MRAAVSVVIPTLNAEAELPGTLAALMEGLSAGVIRELIVADGGSIDATHRIAEAAGAQVLHSAASRGGQLGAGARAAQGEWLLFLHADTGLAPGWSVAVKAHIANSPGEAGYFRLGFDAPGIAPRLVAGWANVRARTIGLPFGDQGLLIARTLYDEIGGYPDIALMEDIAIARALGRRRLAMLPVIARTSAARYAREGWLRRGARNLWLQLRFLCGADPERLAQHYRPSARRS
jgi:rSAM/selenodomain-associated transferase 2